MPVSIFEDANAAMDARDTSYNERNREQTERLKSLRALTDEQLCLRVGEHWTVGAALAHIQYWDGRGLGAIEAWKRHGVPLVLWRNREAPVNDMRLDLWLAIPPREALEQAIVTAEAMDRVIAGLTPDEAAVVAAQRYRVLERAAHRNDHLTEIEQAIALP